jgi:LytS/YehU family sensor histidine kinase
MSVLGWMRLAGEAYDWAGFIRFILTCIMIIVTFTLLYEILYLNKEKEEDIKTVDLLDRERSQAELHALQNEMDPHFLFNSLNTLNHLIVNNPAQAQVYNNRLAQVYKYFLINKNKDLIPLEKELAFLDDYFFLLQLRHDNKLQLEIDIQQVSPQSVKIPPCSLQILLENAIKHNAFSEEEPLRILVTVNPQFIRVENKMKPKPYIIDSTQVGLNNLSSRYKLLLNKDIMINPGKENFTVNLPVIR